MEDMGYADSDGLETVANWHCHPDCPVRKLGEQSGESKSSGGSGIRSGKTGSNLYGDYAGDCLGDNAGGLGDTGTAARFFFQSDWMHERFESESPILYHPKVSRKERDAGLSSHNKHPTLKPITLTKWLATLLLPPEEYAPRRLLVPFAGTGSEMIGALLAGWETIIGVELQEDSVTTARARITWWEDQAARGCTDPTIILKGVKSKSKGKGKDEKPPAKQTKMF